MSYTKGKWRVKRAFGEVWVGTDDEDIAYIEQDASDEENLANAILMASAPRLLTALKAARDAIEICVKHGTPWAQIDTEIIDAAIKQAEGGE